MKSISVPKTGRTRFMVDGNLATDAYALGPVDVFSRRYKVVRETIAYAQKNNGKGKYEYVALMPFRDGLTKLLADRVAGLRNPQEVVEVSKPYERWGTYHYTRYTTVDVRTADRVHVYIADDWQALSERADRIVADNAEGWLDGLAVFYRYGEAFGLLMPVQLTPGVFKEA